MFGVISRFIQSATRDGLVDKIAEANQDYKAHSVSLSDRLDLQHAALLHDSGHLPFSHASEVAVQSLPALARVGTLPIEEFFGLADKAGVRHPKLAELLSIAIVLSPRFQRFYSSYVRPGTEDQTTQANAALRVASLIMGKPPDNCLIAYSDLISGRVIDADKLDYVSRDGMACGIPTGIDVDRLFLRSTFLRFTKDELNRLRRRSGYQPVDSDQVHFIVNSSGRDTIEELIAARTSLYHRVYFHQTTRNAERIYEQLIERTLSSMHAEGRPLDVLQIWVKSDEEMLFGLGKVADPLARELAMRVASRQLPKRSVVFGHGELTPLISFRQAFQRGQIQFEDGPLRLQQLQRYSKRRLFGERLAGLERAIQEESKLLNELIHPALVDTGMLPTVDSVPHIAVSPAQFSPAVHDDCLVLQNHELVYSRELHNVTQTNDAEEIFQAAGYVLTEDPWREIVFVAARKILAEQTRQWTRVEARVGGSPVIGPIGAGQSARLPNLPSGDAEVVVAEAFSVLNLDHDKVIGRAGLNPQRIEMIERQAGANGYFDQFPFLMAKPAFPWEEIRGKFERFEGQYGWQVSKQVVESFLWQFPHRYREHAIDLIKAIEVLDPHTSVALLRQALTSFETARRERGRIRIAPLSPNSGQELRIALETALRSNQDFAKHFSIHHSLAELFAADPRSESLIALIDDNVVTASQAFSQLASWLGIPRDKWPVRLARETNIEDVPLPPESREKLLAAISTQRLGLCVAIGSTKISQPNRRELVALIHKSTQQVSDSQSGLFSSLHEFDLSLFVGREILAARTSEALKDAGFVDFLGDVGQSALAWVRHGKEFQELSSEQRKQCQKDRLGYDNVKGLTLTSRNVPVSTLTCLWAPGKYRQLPWMPLALRRGYGKQIILT